MAKQTFTSGQVLTAAQVNALQANDYNQTVSTKTGSYTLTAADAGTRVVMNSASATTITVNNSLFTAGDTLFIANIGAGTCTITAGSATVSTASSLALAQYGGGTLYFTSASAAIFFSSVGALYGVATGGSSSSITVSSQAYTLLTFTSDGTLTVTKAGLFDLMLVGGGGAGGRSQSNYGTSGGGGGGGVARQTVYLDATTYTIDIGAGGNGVASSIISTIGLPTSLQASTRTYEMTAMGGGNGHGPYYGLPAGCYATGGGAKNNGTGGTALTTQGYNGGSGGSSGAYEGGGGGGGGAGAAGSNGSSNVGGAGGAGLDLSSWLGEAANTTVKGGGGGGGGSGGNGAAGTGNGSANTGGGGRGQPSTASADGLNGYSGIAYVRFKV